MVATSRWTVFQLAAGLFALVCVAAVAADAEQKDEKPDDTWRAWAVTEGKETKLVVEGIYRNGGPGLVVILKDAVPPGPNPNILLLELKTAKLPGVWPTVVQPVPGYYIKAPYKKDRYDAVQIRYPDGSVVSTGKIIDTGSGPN